MQVRYARRAKHVDVLELKTGVWRELHRSATAHGDDGAAVADADAPVQFQDIVGGLRSGDGGDVLDLSVHLCFICLLHLANEETLVVQSPAMDELIVWPEGQLLPRAAG